MGPLMRALGALHGWKADLPEVGPPGGAGWQPVRAYPVVNGLPAHTNRSKELEDNSALKTHAKGAVQFESPRDRRPRNRTLHGQSRHPPSRSSRAAASFAQASRAAVTLRPRSTVRRQSSSCSFDAGVLATRESASSSRVIAASCRFR